MSALFNSDKLKREPYMYFQRDGLLDIYIGLILVLTAVMLWSDLPWLVGIYPVLFLPAWQSAKRSIVAPRIQGLDLPGLSEDQMAAKRLLILGLAVFVLVLGALMFWLLAADNLPAGLSKLVQLAVPVIMGLTGLLVLTFIGYINNAQRFYLYAGLATVVVIISLPLDFSVLWILAGMGATMFLAGVAMLAQFLREFPLPE